MIPLKGLMNKKPCMDKRAAVSKHGEMTKRFEAPVIAAGDKDKVKDIMQYLLKRKK